MTDLTEEKAREILRKEKMPGSIFECDDPLKFNLDRECGKAEGYLLRCSQDKVLIEALMEFKKKFEAMKKRQHQLLVEGQTLETASKNWEEFPEDFHLDLKPLWKALEAFGKGEK